MQISQSVPGRAKEEEMQRPRFLRVSVRSSRSWPLCETKHTRFTWRATLGIDTKARIATNNPELLRDLLARIAYKLSIKDVFLPL